MQVTNLSPINTFKHIMRSFTLFTSIILSIHLLCYVMFSISNPTPALPSLQPCQKILYLDMPLPINVASDPVHLVSCTQHTSIFLLCNVSTTSADLPDCCSIPGCKSYAVWNIISIHLSPHQLPAGHQVYDLHNDGNSVLQFGRVPHHSVSCRQMGLPTRYYGLYPAHFC